MTANNGRYDASLWGIGDAELLGIVNDLADENGWTTTYAVRVQVGEDPWEQTRTGVGVRLGYMRRMGWLEKGERARVESDDDRGWRWSQAWRLTAMGHAIFDNPQLSRSFEAAFAKLTPAQRLALTRELAEAGRGGAEEIKQALRRQWRRSLGVRY